LKNPGYAPVTPGKVLEKPLVSRFLKAKVFREKYEGELRGVERVLRITVYPQISNFRQISI